jgi:thioredoxin-like negative regulator of GroEL
MGVSTLAKDKPKTISRRPRWPMVVLMSLFALACCFWVLWRDARYKSAMDQIESDILAGRHATACRNLERLLSWRADPSGGITYLLGSCELARGRTQAAADVWKRVAPGSAFWEKSIRGRVRLLQESGHYAAAEALVNDAARDGRSDATAIRLMLVPLFRDLGLIDEANLLIEDRWEHENARGEGALEPALKLILQHIELTSAATPVENTRVLLDRAAALVPDDDRVWLGQAYLAIQTGDLERAGRLLDSCQKRRGEDVAVWRARLNWGVATNRTDTVQQAMTRLPPEEFRPSQLHRVKAWLAVQQGDRATERQELEQLLKADPADRRARDRLVQLAGANGEPDRAARLRDEAEEIRQVRARYEKLYQRKQPIRDGVEMAGLAGQLGRVFEARGFLTIALAEDPERADLQRELDRLNHGPARLVERLPQPPG